MVNYKNAKIYKLVNDELNLTYYGSTCDELRKRLYGHKNKSNKCCSKIMFESDEVKIYLVEKFPCNDRIELNQRERFYIENNECINKNIPNRTQKEWYIEWYEINKDKIKESKKKYCEKNREQINKKERERYEKNKEERKQYYQKNKDKIKQQKKEYYQKNKQKLK